MKYNRTLPIIYNQSAKACSSSAVSETCNFFLAQQEKKDFCDPEKLYNEIFPSRDGAATITQASDYAMTKGIPTYEGNRILIKGRTRLAFISPAVICSALDKGPVVFTTLIPTGKNFIQSIINGVYQIPLVSHTMIMIDYDPNLKLVRCANSWGSNFGINGYFDMNFVDINSRNIIEAYSFTI